METRNVTDSSITMFPWALPDHDSGHSFDMTVRFREKSSSMFVTESASGWTVVPEVPRVWFAAFVCRHQYRSRSSSNHRCSMFIQNRIVTDL